MDDVALTDAVCERLGEFPRWIYPSIVDARVGIFYGRIKEQPDLAIGVRVYDVDDDEPHHLNARRVQVRYRGAPGDPTGADDLARFGHPMLLALAGTRGIAAISRLSMGDLGADGNDREQRTDNYLVILDNPEASA